MQHVTTYILNQLDCFSSEIDTFETLVTNTKDSEMETLPFNSYSAVLAKQIADTPVPSLKNEFLTFKDATVSRLEDYDLNGIDNKEETLLVISRIRQATDALKKALLQEDTCEAQATEQICFPYDGLDWNGVHRLNLGENATQADLERFVTRLVQHLADKAGITIELQQIIPSDQEYLAPLVVIQRSLVEKLMNDYFIAFPAAEAPTIQEAIRNALLYNSDFENIADLEEDLAMEAQLYEIDDTPWLRLTNLLEKSALLDSRGNVWHIVSPVTSENTCEMKFLHSECPPEDIDACNVTLVSTDRDEQGRMTLAVSFEDESDDNGDTYPDKFTVLQYVKGANPYVFE